MATFYGTLTVNETILDCSDEHFDNNCDPCDKGGHNREARGYCQQCCEYLCDKCYDYHGKLTATRDHVLLDKIAIPKTQGAQRVKDVLTKKCHKHTGKELEYICNIHDKICCSVCLNLDHASCKDRSYIPDISNNIVDSGEYKLLQADLQNIVSMVTDLQMIMKSAEKQNDRYTSNSLDRLSFIKEQIDDMKERIENEIRREIHRLSQENTDNIQTLSEDCRAILDEMNRLSSNLDHRLKAGEINQLFIDVKLSIQNMSVIKKNVCSLGRWSISRCKIKDIDVNKLESSLKDLMSLSIEYDVPVTKAAYLQELNVKTEDNEHHCSIFGIAVLDNGRVVVIDTKNKSTKLICGKNNKIISNVKLTSEPHDITKTEPDQVSVALPKERKIELFRVSHTLSSIKVLHVPDAAVVGLCYNGELLIAACVNPGSVKMIDMSGNIINTFDIKHKIPDAFTPTGIAISCDKTIVYITDSDANTVTTINTDDIIISVYKNDDLKYPLGVTVGRYGEVIVCSYRNQKIHQLSPTGQLTQILLDTNQRQLAVGPCAIAYSDHGNSIYISSVCKIPNLRNVIRVFNLE